jgi:adenylosuccinate synthase
MVREREVLQEKGIEPQLIIHPLAKVTTPYDVAYNRLTEQKNRHGSCGLGVAATMKRNAETGYKLHAVDFDYKPVLEQKLEKIKQYYLNLVAPEEVDTFTEWYRESEEFFLENIYRKQFMVRDYAILRMFDHVVFEGSQGVLLDMDHGIFPNVTYANTTSKNAVEIWGKIAKRDDHLKVYAVTRCYQTRHGRGWMSNTEPVTLVNNEEEINVFNQWQENFKVGELDYDLLNYATRINKIYSNRYNHYLVVTCLDQRPGFTFDYEKVKGYNKIFESHSPTFGGMQQVKPNLCS